VQHRVDTAEVAGAGAIVKAWTAGLPMTGRRGLGRGGFATDRSASFAALAAASKPG